SMHWAVRGKKEPMLEAPFVHSESSTKTGEWREQAQEEWTPVSKDNEEQADQAGAGIEEKKMPSEDPNCSESLTCPCFSNVNHCHYIFRWSADSPSELLRKFRNYEI
ncbi:dnaJ homolog subfamily C member 12-like, partial [Rhincodon typus]|uniref:dnaJ homolog subfamily C member 12-like n=1 Tax=Rhincodon typus TaxID=259920 RepID=UPI0020304D52